jgi:hypothetical protein
MATAAGDQQEWPIGSAEVTFLVAEVAKLQHLNSCEFSYGSLRADALAGQVNAAQLFQLKRQAVTQRTFRPQLFQQLFRPIECVRLEFTTFENLAPTSCNLVLG